MDTGAKGDGCRLARFDPSSLPQGAVITRYLGMATEEQRNERDDENGTRNDYSLGPG